MHFARALRGAGLPIGPGRVLDAVEAAAEVGLARRDDFYWALHAVLVSRVEHHPLFHEAFDLFWRDDPLPGGLELLLPRAQVPPRERPPVTRRLAEALPAPPADRAVVPSKRIEVDAVLAWSDREALRTRDFDQMSAAEVREAERAVERMRLSVEEVPTRRHRGDPRGERVDPRASLRSALRAGSDAIPLRFRTLTSRPPAVVALCDVSGSMARYARMLLRFLHALSRDRPHVHAFTFGTRLTAVSRQLRHRDVDQAMAAVGKTVQDWEGGTRIGESLREFNLRWSRRLLGQGAIVLLFTDGLDRGDPVLLGAETERLRRSCRRLLWLNPLLRYEGFEPLASGVRAMLPHVDEFRPVHDLESLGQLAGALSGARCASAHTPRAMGIRHAAP
ncbi:MAG: VWA domain-containing protein [Deltaproteobacteria bacterium]|nr:VWA domain-containing protein [Deltaproteobacteria bacterium]